jgi:retinol dehydrogenase-12
MESELRGKWAVVTGASSGIGRVTAETLAARGASVVLACRSEEKSRAVLDAIRSAGGEATFQALDLGDLASVRACAQRLLARDRKLDLLINNAGVAGQRGLTKDGFELNFGTNHLGHFLLTVLLAPRLRAAAPSRIVNVASASHYRAKKIDYSLLRQPTRSVTGLPEYEVSKLANVLFTKELARRLGPSGVHSYSLHPGMVASDAWRRIPRPFSSLMKLFMLSNEEGAATTLYCATSPEVADHDGRYYHKCKERRPNRAVEDEAMARRLWEKSVEWVGSDLG